MKKKRYEQFCASKWRGNHEPPWNYPNDSSSVSICVDLKSGQCHGGAGDMMIVQSDQICYIYYYIRSSRRSSRRTLELPSIDYIA